MEERQSWELPEALVRHLPDSGLAVVSWDGANSTLSFRVKKDIGPESGLLTFRGVLHINLPPWVEISGIEAGDLNDQPPDFLASSRPGDLQLGPDEKIFFIHGSWGEEFFVIAEAIDYEVQRQ